MASHKVLSATLFCLAFWMGQLTYAETIGSKISRAVGLSSAMKTKWNAKPVSAHGQVRMEGMHYLTTLPGQEHLTNSYLLSAKLVGYQETSWFDFAGDLSGGTFFSAGQSHVVVSEAYVATHGKDFKIYLGRKKMPWSEADRRWDLGLIQSRFALDLLRPEEQGLVGLFADYNRRNFQFTAMATPIFIPNMGSEYREEGGSLLTDSRWYRQPSQNYDFNNKINKIVYRLDVPDTLDLVNQPGAMMMARVGDKDKGAWVSVTGGYIPVSELILKRQNYKSASQERVDVTVSPEVTHHVVRAADAGYTFNNKVSAGVSYIAETPREKIPEKDWSIQSLRGIEAYAAFIDLSLSNFIISSLDMQIQYLKARGGNIVDIDHTGAPDDFTMFEERMKFKDALSVSVQGQLTSFLHKPIMTKFKYLYDYEQQGSLLNAELLYFPHRSWAVVLGGDVLGVKDEDHNPSSFLNQYRANDRYYGGVTYVF